MWWLIVLFVVVFLYLCIILLVIIICGVVNDVNKGFNYSDVWLCDVSNKFIFVEFKLFLVNN